MMTGATSGLTMINRQLGAYTIVAPLGAGGMGEVYRAHDNTLGRDVAIKILPARFTADAERRERFAREARLLATLNHPNIGAIYGVEEADGLTALVLELVEGPTLADRLAQGPLSVGETVAVAQQLADALATAHEKGIIHRDLKPANIVLNRAADSASSDVRVKVLDFGVAKTLAAGPAADSEWNGTTAVASTADGRILGTPAYMSPEQARGQAVDRRTDLWAFGCILFEMLSGRHPFEGETPGDMVARILEREPDWRMLPQGTPPAMRTLAERCLRKDVRKRLHDIVDARIELDDVDLSARPADSGDAADSGARKRLWINWLAALAAGAAVGVAATLLYLRTPPPALAPIEYSVSPPPGAVFYRHFEVSPDGQKIVVAATSNDVSQLWVRPTTAPAWREVAGTEDARFPFWSPDNQSIGFFAKGQLKTVKLDGAPPVVVCDCNVQGNFVSGSWNQEGVILFSGLPGPLRKIRSNGGSPTPVTSSRDSTHVWPWFLPDGDHFLYIERSDPFVLRVGSLSSANDVVLGPFESHVTYAKGHLLFVRKGWLMAQPFDTRTRHFTGDAMVVADHSNDSARPRGDFSASPAGVLARLAPSEGRRLTWVNRTGATVGTIGPPGEYSQLSLSRDGRNLAVSMVTKAPGEEANFDIWHFDLERAGTPTRLTHDPDESTGPTFSPDGTQIAFVSSMIGRPYSLFTRRITSAENVPVLTGSGSPLGGFAPDWSEDGRWLIFSAGTLATGADLWKLALTGDRTPSVFLRTRFSEMRAALAPDGHWIAFESDQSGESEIYVRPFPEGDGEIKISNGGGRSVAWRRDGRELFFLALDGTMMAVAKTSVGSFRAGTQKPLFQTDLNWFGENNSYAVASEGRFLLTVPVNASGNPRPIEVVLNWTAKLRQEQR